MEENEEVRQNINFLDKPLWFQGLKQKATPQHFVWTDIDGYKFETYYKLPDKTDILFLLYLLYCSQQQDYSEDIILSKYSILKKCGFPPNTKYYYNRLDESLKRWSNVQISFSGTFYSEGHIYSSISFGIISGVGKREDGKLHVKFNKAWLEKIKNSNYSRHINFSHYKLLKRASSRRLFEILCKNFIGRDTWGIKLVNLGKKLTLSSRNGKYYASDVKKSIHPAIADINKLATIKNAKTLGLNLNKLFTISYTITGEKQDRKIIFTRHPVKIKTIPVPKSTKTKPVVAKPIKKANTPKPDTFVQKQDIFVPKPDNDVFELLQTTTSGLVAIVDDYINSNGVDYVRANILYANEHAKNNYACYVQRALKNNWAEEYKQGLIQAETPEQKENSRIDSMWEALESKHQDIIKSEYETFLSSQIDGGKDMRSNNAWAWWLPNYLKLDHGDKFLS